MIKKCKLLFISLPCSKVAKMSLSLCIFSKLCLLIIICKSICCILCQFKNRELKYTKLYKHFVNHKTFTESKDLTYFS